MFDDMATQICMFSFSNCQCLVSVCGSVVICIDSARFGRKILDDHRDDANRRENTTDNCSFILHPEMNLLLFPFIFVLDVVCLRQNRESLPRTSEHQRLQSNPLN